MIVVSDTSPLTALIHIQRAELLPLLYGSVVIPPSVKSELLRDHPTVPGWLEVISPGTLPVEVAGTGLGDGETAAIALALKIGADAILMDEKAGRRLAQSLGLKTIGVLGCLILAHRRGHLPTIANLISDLRVRAGCWFSPKLVEEVLRATGELISD